MANTPPNGVDLNLSGEVANRNIRILEAKLCPIAEKYALTVDTPFVPLPARKLSAAEAALHIIANMGSPVASVRRHGGRYQLMYRHLDRTGVVAWLRMDDAPLDARMTFLGSVAERLVDAVKAERDKRKGELAYVSSLGAEAIKKLDDL